MANTSFSPIELEVAVTLFKRDYSIERISKELNIPLKRAKALISFVTTKEGTPL